MAEFKGLEDIISGDKKIFVGKDETDSYLIKTVRKKEFENEQPTTCISEVKDENIVTMISFSEEAMLKIFELYLKLNGKL